MTSKEIKRKAWLILLGCSLKIIFFLSMTVLGTLVLLSVCAMIPVLFFHLIGKPIIEEPYIQNILNDNWLISEADLVMIYFVMFVIIVIVAGLISSIREWHRDKVRALEDENKETLLLEGITGINILQDIVEKYTHLLPTLDISDNSAPCMVRNAIYLMMKDLPDIKNLNRIQKEYIQDELYKAYKDTPDGKMHPYSQNLKDTMGNLSDREKIRLFYELAKYISKNTEDTDDAEMNTLFADIQNVIIDIENL